jgi:hypothetical protein
MFRNFINTPQVAVVLRSFVEFVVADCHSVPLIAVHRLSNVVSPMRNTYKHACIFLPKQIYKIRFLVLLKNFQFLKAKAEIVTLDILTVCVF